MVLFWWEDASTCYLRLASSPTSGCSLSRVEGGTLTLDKLVELQAENFTDSGSVQLNITCCHLLRSQQSNVGLAWIPRPLAMAVIGLQADHACSRLLLVLRLQRHANVFSLNALSRSPPQTEFGETKVTKNFFVL